MIKNNSQALRDELHELRNEAHVIKNNSQALKNNSQITRNEAQALRDNSQIIRNEAYVLRDNDKTKTIDNTAVDRISNKIGLINKIDNILSNVNIKLPNNVKSIYEAINVLEDEIWDDDPWLRLFELNKIKDILDDALNVIWYEIKKIE